MRHQMKGQFLKRVNFDISCERGEFRGRKKDLQIKGKFSETTRRKNLKIVVAVPGLSGSVSSVSSLEPSLK